MGTSFCEVIHAGNVVGFCSYQTTADVAGTPIAPTIKAAFEAPGWPKCSCGQPPTDVLLVAFYGGDFYWPAKACLRCQCITEGFDPWEVGDGWPKDGHPLGGWQHERETMPPEPAAPAV